jgi:arabinogalactan endo-1,4-beta-galactosidase
MAAQGVAFDVIGQSYYPRWHGTLGDLKSNLTDPAERHKRTIIVVEYSVPNVKEINDIVHEVPAGRGLGTFIWEPTARALFDRHGATTPAIDVYPELAKAYAGKARGGGRRATIGRTEKQADPFVLLHQSSRRPFRPEDRFGLAGLRSVSGGP